MIREWWRGVFKVLVRILISIFICYLFCKAINRGWEDGILIAILIQIVVLMLGCLLSPYDGYFTWQKECIRIMKEDLKKEKALDEAEKIEASEPIVLPRPKVSHYQARKGPEPIDIILDWDLDFCMGAIVKYIYRHGLKPGNESLADLRKAVDYIAFEAERYSGREWLSAVDAAKGMSIYTKYKPEELHVWELGKYGDNAMATIYKIATEGYTPENLSRLCTSIEMMVLSERTGMIKNGGNENEQN